MNKTLYWAARGFAIFFIAMTALFTLDLNPFSWTGLFMHLLPTLILLIILGVSWVQEKIGGILWILAAIAYIIIAWGDVSWLAYLTMSGPALVIGLLFLWPKNETMNMPQAAPVTPEVAQEVPTASQAAPEPVEPPSQDEANIS